MQSSPSRSVGIFTGLASATAFAGMNLIVRVCAGKLDATACVAARGMVGLLVLTPLVWRDLGAALSLRGWALWAQCVFGGLASLALFHNVHVIGVGEAVALSYLAPLFVAVAAPIIFHERVGLYQVLGTLVMTAGALCLQLVHTPWRMSMATAVGIGGAMCGAASLMTLKRAAQQHSPWLAAWTFCLFSVVGVLAFAPAATLAQMHAHAMSAGVIGVLGAAGQILLSWSFKRLTAAMAGALSLCTLIFSVAFEGFYSAVWPQGLRLLGYTLICAGLLVLQLPSRRTKLVA